MPWELVGVSSVTTATSSPITLSEPSGVREGDLLVACLADRNAFGNLSLATGWTTAGTQQTSQNDLTFSPAIAGALMAFIMRGASAPSYAFNRGASAVCQGAVVAYRYFGEVIAYDTGSGNTLGSDTGSVTTASINTKDNDTLLVAMCAGGQEGTVSSFAAATDPSTASGSTDTTTHPTVGAWIERVDAQTTSGPDTSITIADAVKATPGPTGTVSCTHSASHRHAMIVGAFRIMPKILVLPGLMQPGVRCG